MADQRSAEARHLIARIKRIPQPASGEVEARLGRREREAACNRDLPGTVPQQRTQCRHAASLRSGNLARAR